jgi:hypothetical protein
VKKCPTCGEWEEDGNDECTNCGSDLDISDLLPTQKQIVRVLSVRQPWAWLIVNGWKNIENRDRSTSIRGRILIHAAKATEYRACSVFLNGFSWGPELLKQIPPMSDMQHGGIVGEATILDCVDHHESEWFTGRYGFVLADQKPLPFVPLKGRLGFFTWDGTITENSIKVA